MSLEVTINVPGLKELSEALMQLAVAMGGKSVQMDEAAVGQAVHEQQSTEASSLGGMHPFHSRTQRGPYQLLQYQYKHQHRQCRHPQQYRHLNRRIQEMICLRQPCS